MSSRKLTNYEDWLEFSKSEMISTLISETRTYVNMYLLMAEGIKDETNLQSIKLGPHGTLAEGMNILALQGERLLEEVNAAALALRKLQEQENSNKLE